MVILHQCCFYKKEIQMFSFVKDFKSSCENIHKSMPGRGELVLFSSLPAGEKTGSVSFRRSGLALRWVLAPGCRQTRVMEPHPGRTPESIPSGARRRAGCPGRRWEPRAEAACCAGASATAALRGSILSLRGDWSTAGGGLESAVRAGETVSQGSLGSGKRTNWEEPPPPSPASSVARGVLPASESGSQQRLRGLGQAGPSLEKGLSSLFTRRKRDQWDYVACHSRQVKELYSNPDPF